MKMKQNLADGGGEAKRGLNPSRTDPSAARPRFRRRMLRAIEREAAAWLETLLAADVRTGGQMRKGERV